MKKKINYSIILLLSGLIFSNASSAAEITLTYSEGKNRLLKESLQVLAEYYHVNLAQTEVQAARTWNNPLFVWNADMYSHEQNSYFHMGNQTLVQVEYVIGVSGERIQAIRQANLGVEIAELAFLDVVRGLVMEYSETYNRLYLLKEKSNVYDVILKRYDYLIASDNKRLELGIISFNDLVRIKSELVSIQTEATANRNEILSEQQHLNTLLNLPAETVVIPEEPEFEFDDSLNSGQIITMAEEFRPDLKLAQKNISYYEQSLKTEQAKGGPSINMGYQPRDRGSNYVRPYAGLVFEVTLPIFDRNQAGIQTARIQIDQSKTNLEIFTNNLQNEVFSAYMQYINNSENLASYTPEFMTELTNLSAGAVENFEKKNITLLEFLDFQQIYLDSEMQYLEMKSNYLYSFNFLSFVVGKDLTISTN